MSEDFAEKSLDVDSTFRNRNNYPNPYDFVIPYSFPNKGSTALGFFDPVLESSPYTGSSVLQPGQLVTEGTFLPMITSTTTDIVLDALDSPIDNFYINSSLQIVSQFREIIAYDGFTKVCTVSVPFSVAPPAGTVYYTRKQRTYFNSDVAIYTANTLLKTTDKLNLLTATPSPIKDFYAGSYIRFTNGSHVGETALITKYDPIGNTETWNQENGPGLNSFISTTEEGGFLFSPTTTGILENITLNLTSFESIDPGRTLRLKIYSGAGFNSSVLYTNDLIVSNNLSSIDYDFLFTGGPTLTSGIYYTCSLQDITAGSTSTGYINIFGITPYDMYRTYNLTTYPKVSISIIDGSAIQAWSQPIDTGMNDYLSVSSEKGFRISSTGPPGTTSLSTIVISMMSFETVSAGRTITLRIRDGSGLSGTILFQNDYIINNTSISATDVSITITGGPTLTIGNQYTLTLLDTTPGGTSTGYVNLFGISSNVTYTSYNTLVYPRLIINDDGYNQTDILSTVLANNRQGISVSSNYDGSILVVGSPQGSITGKTQIYNRSGSSWTFLTNLIGTGNIGLTGQGTSVSISSDSTTIAIGGPSDNTNIGAIWIFTLLSGIWVQQAKLIGTGGVSTQFQGTSTSLSSDGNTLAVGGYLNDSNNGAVWIFTRSAGIWTQQSLIYDNLYPGMGQGWRVSLSSDGNTLCYGCSIVATQVGGGWIYTRSGNVWTKETFLFQTGGDPGTINLGYSCSISDDGNTCVLGAPQDKVSGVTRGTVYVYKRSGVTWNQNARLSGTPNIGLNNSQGFSCSLSGDGNTLSFCAEGDNGGVGAMYVYKFSGGSWTQFSKTIPTGGSGLSDQFGISCSISKDGYYIAVGTPGYSSNTGGTWIFSSTPIFNQLSNPVVSSVVSLSTEGGFKFIPTTSGIVSTLLLETSSFESLSSGRTVEIKIRDGGGVGGSIIYSGTTNIVNNSRGNIIINIGGGGVVSGNTYTITLKDVTSGGYSTGNLFIYGISSNLSFVSYNIATYPLMAISVSNSLNVFSQNNNPTVSDYLSVIDKGFSFTPFFSGGISMITLSLSSFGVLGYRTTNLKILSGGGLGGSVVYTTSITIGNVLSRSDYSFGILLPTTVLTGNQYTLVLTDTTPGGNTSGLTTFYGINNVYPYLSYNTSVYPKINFKISSYVITISPPKLLDGFLNNPSSASFLLTGTDDNIEFNSQAHDNATTLFQNGLNSHNAQYYKIGLKYIVIPNQILSCGRGGTFGNYPYIYVQIYNDGYRGSLNVMVSDNPSAANAVFKCPIDRNLYNIPKAFFTLKTPNKDQIVKFRPDQNIRITLTLPNGEIISTQLVDNLNPLFPNPLLQINAMFTLVPVDKNKYSS